MIPAPLRHLLFLLVTAALGLISIRSSAAELPPDVAVAPLGSWTAPPESPALAVVRENELTYVAVGNAGLLVLDISDPTAPALAGSWTNGAVSDLALASPRAYAIEPGGLLRVLDLADRRNPRPTAALPLLEVGQATSVAANSNLAFVTFQSDPLLGGTLGKGGLRIINTTNATNPVVIGSLPLGGAPARVAASGSYALVAATFGPDGASGLHIVDVSTPAAPRRVGGLFDGLSVSDVAVSDGRAFVVVSDRRGSTNFGEGLYLVDFTDATRPRVTGRYPTQDPAVTGTNASPCCWSPERVTIDGPRAGLTSRGLLEWVDVSTPTTPRFLGRFDPNWIPAAQTLSLPYAVVAADNGVHVLDLTDPQQITRTGGYGTAGQAGPMALDGSRVYLPHGAVGLEVLQWDGVAPPRHLGTAPTRGDARAVAIQGSLAYVADGTAGLTIIDPADPTAPRVVGRLALGGWEAHQIGFAGGIALVAEAPRLDAPTQGRLRTVRVSDPTHPRSLGTVDTGGLTGSLATEGAFAYLAVAGVGVVVIDLTDPSRLVRLADLPEIPSASSLELAVDRHRLYVSVSSLGLRVFDLTDPAHPQPLGSVAQTFSGPVAASGSIVCVSRDLPQATTFEILDANDPARLIPVGQFSGPSGWTILTGDRLLIAGPRFARASNPLTLAAYQITRPAQPQRFGTWDSRAWSNSIPTGNAFAWTNRTNDGWQVTDVSDPTQPRRLGSLTTVAGALGLAVSGSIGCRSAFRPLDGWIGLEVLDLADPRNPVLVGELEGVSSPQIVLSEGHAYLLDQGTLSPEGIPRRGLHVVSLTDPSQPRFAAVYDPEVGDFSPSAVAVDGPRAYLSYNYFGAVDSGPGRSLGALDVVDVSTPSLPRRVGRWTTDASITALAVGNGRGVVLTEDGLHRLDLTDPSQPRAIGSYPLPNATAVALAGSIAYVYQPSVGLVVLDVSNPAAPRRLGGNSAFFGDGGAAVPRLAVAGDRLLAGMGSALVSFAIDVPLRLAIGRSGTGFELLLDGPPGMVVRLQRGTDPAEWNAWQDVSLPGTTVHVTDPDAGTEPVRFYRAVAP